MSDAVGYLLKKAGVYPLCTPEEELELSQFIFNNKHLLTIEDAELTEEELKLKNTTQKKLDEFVNRNLRLVISIVKKYRSSTLSFEDMFQEGAIGLRTGILKFDPTKGYKLSTFAYWWIRQSITRAIQNNSSTIRKPIHVQDLHRSIKRAIKEYETKHGVRPSTLYIAEELNITTEKVINTLSAMMSTGSLDVNITNSDGQPTLLLDLLADTKVITPDEVAQVNSISETLDELLDTLESRDREIVALYYGLIDGKPLSLQKIGNRLGVTRECIRQRLAKSLQKLKTHRQIENLRELYLL